MIDALTAKKSKEKVFIKTREIESFPRPQAFPTTLCVKIALASAEHSTFRIVYANQF